ncbi:MAG: CerR family C-terminal domain-containing protein [Thermodesulfobacteriota bacterium]
MTGQNKSNDPTRDKLLKAAEKLFAAKGYDAVSVREITSAAGVHLASVNYHFGGKENLYHEVFRSLWLPRAKQLRRPLEELERREDLTAEEIVRTMARIIFEIPLTEAEHNRHRLLVVQEMLQPGRGMEMLAREFFHPTLELVARLLGRALGGEVDHNRLRLYAVSLMAQVNHFSLVRRGLSRMLGREDDEGFVAGLLDHIADFALRGLSGARRI